MDRLSQVVFTVVCVILSLQLGVTNGAEFVTAPQDLVVMEGDTIVLECGVTVGGGQGSLQGLWHFYPADGPLDDSKLLAIDGNILTKGAEWQLDISSVVEDGAEYRNLKIENIQVTNEGSYVCTMIGGEQIKQKHTLTVNVLPSISLTPDVETLQAEKGTDVVITCIGQGKPMPTVTWERTSPETTLPNGDMMSEGSDLILSDLQPYDSGIYQCTAQNEAGTETQTIELKVMYPPSVVVEEEWIHTGPGDNVDIFCTFMGSPEVVTRWLHNGTEISASPRSNMKFGQKPESYSDVHFMHLAGVTPVDLGLYECEGRNDRGKARGTAMLSALPHSLEVTSGQHAPYSDQYTLGVRVISLPKITEWKVVIHQMNNTEDVLLLDETLPGSSAESSTHHFTHIIDNLTPNTTYSGRIQAKNAFGSTNWTGFSFITAEEGNSAPLPTTTPVARTTEARAKYVRPNESPKLMVSFITILTAFTLTAAL